MPRKDSLATDFNSYLPDLGDLVTTMERKLDALIDAQGFPPAVVYQEKVLPASGDYNAGDVLSDGATGSSLGRAWHFPGMALTPGGAGTITKAVALLSVTALTPALTIFFFDRIPTSELDDMDANTAVLLADRFGYQGRIDLAAMADIGTGMSESIATPSTDGNIPFEFKCAGASKDLWGIVVTNDAITGEAANMTLLISLFVRQG